MSVEQARILAYKKMVELMTNKQGVEPKIIANGRCKVVFRKNILYFKYDAFIIKSLL